MSKATNRRKMLANIPAPTPTEPDKATGETEGIIQHDIHELKTWPDEYEAVHNLTKTFEYRKNDRDFKVGDFLHLNKYSPETKEYCTVDCGGGSHYKRTIAARVTLVIQGGQFGIPKDYCIMQIEVFDYGI